MDIVIGETFRIVRAGHSDRARVIPFGDGRKGGRLYEPTPFDRGPWHNRRCGTVYTHHGERVEFVGDGGAMVILPERASW